MSKKKKILLSCDYFYPSVGGVEVFMEDLGVHMMDLGYQVEVSARWLPERKFHTRKGLKIHSFKCDGLLEPNGDEAEREKFYNLIYDGGFDHVLMLTQPDNWVASALLHKRNSSTRLTLFPSINSMNVAEWSKSGRWDQVVQVIKDADQTVAVTATGLDHSTLTNLGLDPIYLPHAIEKDAAKTNFRKKHGLDPERPLLVMVANFWPVKNHSNLLRVLGRTQNDWQIVIIGNPISAFRTYFEEVKELADLDKRVCLIPGLSRPEAASAIRDADLLMIPSIGESAGPLVALQAMSYGTPWIATPNCNAVQDQAGGLSVSLEQFPTAIEYLLTNKKVLSDLGRAGKKQWENSFTWEKIAPAFKSLLDDKEIPDFRISEGLKKEKAKLQSEFDTVISKAANSDKSTAFTVIIPTYNRSKTLVKCLDALSQQTFPADQFEVIVCNDGSTDDTADVIKNFEPSFHLSYIRQENAGPAKARNKGLEKACGRLVMFINDDTILARDALARHYETHRAHPGEKIAVLGTFDFPDEYQKNWLVQLINKHDLLFEYNKMQPGGYYDYNFFYTCNLSVPKQAVLDVGMFDEIFDGPASEDIDLGVRLYKEGYQLLYQPECRSLHEHPVTLDGFCRTHHLRGYGHVTYMLKYPEFNFLHKMNPDEVWEWVEAWHRLKPQIDQLRNKLDEYLTEKSTLGDLKDTDPVLPAIKLIRDYYFAMGQMGHPRFQELLVPETRIAYLDRIAGHTEQPVEDRSGLQLSQKSKVNPISVSPDYEVFSSGNQPGKIRGVSLPVISVIVPTYNRSKTLEKCLQALAEQTFPAGQFEVIVCDDGSTDDTPEVVKNFKAPFKLSYVRQDNAGPAKARNRGLEKARGQFVLFINDDTILDKEALHQHHQTHLAHPGEKISVLGTFEFPEEYRKTILVQLINENDLLFEYNKMQPGGYHAYNYFYTCNLSVPLQAVMDVGMFDETFDGPAAEDIDLGYRLHYNGYRLLYQPECKSIHDHPVTLDGFCRTHKVRGYGQMTLASKYSELNYWQKMSADQLQRWISALDKPERTN